MAVLWPRIVEQLVHGAGGLGATGLADDLGRNTGDRGVVWHRLEHDRSGGDAGAVTDFDIAEEFGARSDQYAAADLGMTVARLLAGAAERHLLQDRDVVLDHGGLADDEAGGVVKEDAAADRHGRIDVGLEHSRRAALQIVGKILATLFPKPMGQAVSLDGVEAFEIQHRLEEAIGRGVTIEGRHDVGAERLADRGIAFERVAISLPAQLRRDICMIEPLGDAMPDGGVVRVVVKDGRRDEGRKLRLAANDLFGLAADARPDRIDLVERVYSFRLFPSHDDSPNVILTTMLAQQPWSWGYIRSACGRAMHGNDHGRTARNASTPALKTLSPTACIWSRPGMSRGSPAGSSAASSCAEPATSSAVPTATSAGIRIALASARVSVWREPRMQAASALRSDRVCSAKARNTRPWGSETAAREGASSASAIDCGKPTPSTRWLPNPPRTMLRTRSGCASAR